MAKKIIDFKTGERIEYISINELEKIVNYCVAMYAATDKKIWLRDAFIFSFMFWTGVRATELVLTKVEDIDFDREIYTVPQLKKDYWKAEAKKLGFDEKEIEELCKNPLRRAELGLIGYVEIPISHVPSHHIKLWKKYINVFDLQPEDNIVKIKRKAIWVRIKKISKEVLGREVHPHALRHSCGVFVIHNLDLEVIDAQRILRHSSLASTERYIRLKVTDLQKKIKSYLESTNFLEKVL